MSEQKIEDFDELTTAIQLAKDFLRKAFRGETIENLGLEEVQQDASGSFWDITLGFNRLRDIPRDTPNEFLRVAAAAAAARPPRVLKVVRIDMLTGRARSITNWKED